MSDLRCGTTAGYQVHTDNKTRHCRACKTAQADWQRHYRTRMYLAGGKLCIDATGTRRRLRALARMGWAYDTLGPRFGISGSAVSAWTATPMVRRSTAERVAAVYDELWNQRGPSSRAASKAALKGWPPPLAWDDDDIDDPAAIPADPLKIGGAPLDRVAVAAAISGRGRRAPLNRAEMADAFRWMDGHGYSLNQIADRLGVTQRTVARWRVRAALKPSPAEPEQPGELAS